jgi:hypothetical protein
VSLRAHRNGDTKVRHRIPERHIRRREGAHDLVRTRWEPEVCVDCYGKGYVYDVRNAGDSPIRCPSCDGEGEV